MFEQCLIYINTALKCDFKFKAEEFFTIDTGEELIDLKIK